MKEASQNLCSVTLELGEETTVVDQTADLNDTVEKLFGQNFERWTNVHCL